MATTKVSTKLLETVGVAEGATGATSTSAARTSLGLVIGTNVLAPGGDGSSLTGIAGGATDAEKSNIMLNAFRISVNGGLSVQNMVDGVVDEFEDETGVDTSTSTNETYNATSDFYSSPGMHPSYTNSGGTGDRTASITVAAFGTWGSTPTNGQVDGNTGSNNGYPGPLNHDEILRFDFGSGASKVITEIKFYMNVTSSEGTWRWYGSDNASSWATVGAQFTFQGSTAGTINTSMSANATGYRYYEIRAEAGSQSGNEWREFEFKIDDYSVVLNITLVSNATTALAAPDDANIVIWQEDVDSVTLNTDLKAYASRDGGSTYTQITLSEDTAIAADGGYTSDVVPTMTSDTAPSGTVSANYVRSGSAAYGVFDENIASLRWDHWNSGFPAWLAYEFTSNKTIARYTIEDANEGYHPTNWTFEGWTGSAWVVLDTETVGLTQGQKKTFDIPNTTSYIKYRWNFTASNGSSVVIAQMEMMETITLSQRALSGSVDISGQPSGTSMKYKIETLNTKEQKIHAVALQWS